jgi:hypothetical protein
LIIRECQAQDEAYVEAKLKRYLSLPYVRNGVCNRPK